MGRVVVRPAAMLQIMLVFRQRDSMGLFKAFALADTRANLITIVIAMELKLTWDGIHCALRVVQVQHNARQDRRVLMARVVVGPAVML